MPKHSFVPLILGCLASALPPVPATGQDSGSKLDTLKAQYQAEVTAAESGLKEKYVAALERMQQQLQAGAKLEAALAVKREREKIEAELAAAGGGSTPGLPVPSGASEFVFQPENASAVGAVEFTEKWGALTGWRGEGSGAEWDLSSVPKGVYSVILEYASPYDDGGNLQAEQGTAAFKIPVAGTGGWVSYTPLQAGQIVVDNPSSPLRIVVADDAGTPFGLINLRSVTLKRIGVDE